ncbi:MAG: 4Fe-4S ferredoxin, partial [Deltaproteobacteria bacterium]|nr:4Fe-4S ferredoxin [Deltaproteobacteria bacterium]
MEGTNGGPGSGAAGDRGMTRRGLLRKGGLVGLLAGLFGGGALAKEVVAPPEGRFSDSVGELFQQHYKKMTPEEVAEAISRIERQAKREYGVDLEVGNAPPLEGVVYGYALNISKCKGVRNCVEACVAENNQSRDSQIQYIRVLELDHGHMDLLKANQYYEADEVPRKGKYYLPIQCMQCNNPPCVKACPVEATWKEADGIVVVDYNWCIGCRYCM